MCKINSLKFILARTIIVMFSVVCVQNQDVVPISSYDTAGSFLILGCNNGSIYYIGESQLTCWLSVYEPVKMCLKFVCVFVRCAEVSSEDEG